MITAILFTAIGFVVGVCYGTPEIKQKITDKIASAKNMFSKDKEEKKETE